MDLDNDWRDALVDEILAFALGISFVFSDPVIYDYCIVDEYPMIVSMAATNGVVDRDPQDDICGEQTITSCISAMTANAADSPCACS